MTDWLEALNAEQRQAAMAGPGPLMVVAGPGTGKTGTLAARVAWLVASGTARPEEVVALTFTTKAAEELRGRVERLLASSGPVLAVDRPAVLTFHALAQRLLAEAGQTPGRLIAEDERLAVIRALERPTQLQELPARELALRLSRYRNTEAAAGSEDGVWSELATQYRAALAELGAGDFDDLILQAYAVARAEGSSVTRPRYLLIDEFQDTSDIQYALARQLQSADNLAVIGDPRQSIYGFRGAGAAMFDRFTADFPAAQTVTLSTNYRSAGRIVALGNAVFPDAAALTAHTTMSGRTRLIQTLDEAAEADWIVAQIEAELGGTDFQRAGTADHGLALAAAGFSDFAIIYRTHRLGQALQRRLADSGLPYQVAGEGSPYDRPELRLLVRLLSLLAGRAAAETPTPGESPVWQRLTAAQQVALLDEWRLQGLTEPPSCLAVRLARQLGLGQTDMAARRDLAQLLALLARFDHTAEPLAAAVAHLQAIAEQEFYDPSADAITLLTIHAAKGLEFAHVFVCALEEDRLPHRQPGGQATDIEEERRLFYVAITRAKRQLDLTYTQSRSGRSSALSRFIKEVTAPELELLADPAMAAQQRQRQRRQVRRAQGRLF